MSKKNLDQQGRLRSVIVSFRVSPEEGKLLNTKVALSGLTKQDYIIHRLMEQEITVVGSPRVYKALKDQLAAVQAELMRLNSGAEVSPELRETIRLIARTLEGMGAMNAPGQTGGQRYEVDRVRGTLRPRLQGTRGPRGLHNCGNGSGWIWSATGSFRS